MSYYSTMVILHHLAPGTPVSVWFDNSGFLATYFQFFVDNEVAFSGGALNGGLTYVNARDIRAIKVGH
ncbi:hypothetical protein LLE49_26650 [Alicyclobacillus tolerans]|uniref:hypothetical protein n=1 Tax=Alicyclobacillus tolerans TaxID=90970 RepID=UPI001F42F7D8|nr:hypothetical protein [Alicyclobacillus tolerans]MCF8568306.1 hypothetical protein [Alicyclobacillus tolerans]